MAVNSSGKANADMVQEALTLIEDGSRSVANHRDVSDVVLVIGNTGAGKSTIAKLLIHPEELESHKAIDRYLIRDKAQKISGDQDTTVSKTIVPELLFDPHTNTAVYDLPGFCDTRSEAVEIANAFFMKKVADEAKRVKLLFVVSHSSVLSGENRTDLKAFLENSAELIKNPKKFAPAIGLIVTKVRGEIFPSEVVTGIVMYLSVAKKNLRQTMSDESQRIAAEDIINAILTRDSSGNYSRIAYFSEPKEGGPIQSLNSVMEEKEEICKVLQNSLSYCPSTPDDFGLSVSPSAQFLILKIADRLQTDIAQVFKTIGVKLEKSFAAVVERISFVDIGTQVKTLETFEKSIDMLQQETNVGRKDFFQKFWEISTPLKTNDGITTENQGLQQIQKDLAFLEDFSGFKFPSRTLEWTVPIQFSVTFMKKAVAQRILVFQTEMETQLRQLVKTIDKCLQEKIVACKDDANEKSRLLQDYSHKVVQLNEALNRASSVNEFVQEVQSNVTALDSEIPTSTIVKLGDDLSFRAAFLSVWQWRKPFEDMEGKLREQSSLHALQSKNKEEIENLQQKSAEAAKQQNKRMEQMKEEYLKNAKEQDEKLIQEKEEMQKKINRVKGDFKEQQKKHKEELDRQRNELESSLKEMKSKTKEEIEKLEQKSADDARKQNQRMEDMRSNHEKHVQEQDDRLKREKEDMQRKVDEVKSENKKQQEQYEEEMRVQKQQMQASLDNLMLQSKQQEEKFARDKEEQVRKLETLKGEQQAQQMEILKQMDRQRQEDKEKMEAEIQKVRNDAEEKQKQLQKKAESSGHALGILGDVIDFFPFGRVLNKVLDGNVSK